VLDAEVLAAVGGFLIKAHQIPEGLMREIEEHDIEETTAAPILAGLSVRDRMAARAARLNQL
jgi:hypothetical protein